MEHLTTRARDDLGFFTVLVDGERWTETTSLAESGGEDKVFMLDSCGTIVFGDGKHGRQPPVGAAVKVSYAQGGGESGNVQVSLSAFWPPPVSSYVLAIKDNQSISIRGVGQKAEHFSGEKRVRYFSGQKLSANDFRDEQQYLLQKRYRHNQVLHGVGIVAGLEISISESTNSTSLVIDPGFALDCAGRELNLTAQVALEVTDTHTPQYVIVEYTERETDWVPSPGENTSTMPSRIEDGLVVRLDIEQDICDGVAIGRIVFGPTGWDVDRGFQPLRPR